MARQQLKWAAKVGQARGIWGYDGEKQGLCSGSARRQRGTVTTSTEDSPIYLNAISGWMATHEGRMPGVVLTSGKPDDDIVVDTPYLDDVAKNGVVPWGRNRGVTRPIG